MAMPSISDRLASKTGYVRTGAVPASDLLETIPDPSPTVVAQSADEVINAVVAECNDRFFVSTEGNTAFVYEEAFNHESGRPELRRLTLSAFKQLHSTDLVSIPKSSGGVDTVSKALIWLTSPNRRTFSSGFALLPTGKCPPTIYNLWRGWGVPATAGDVSFILSYIESVLCSGNREYYEYLIQWLAHCVQHPSLPAQVAVVLRGGKGIGKSTLGRLMVLIFGVHGMQITNSRHLLGNFNGHLKTTLLLFADEAFYAGDPQGASVLKGLVTEDALVIEQKGIDAVQVTNRLKIIMASNSDWVVPASSDERRFFVLEVSHERQGDFAYWDELNRGIYNGGAAVFLDYLLNVDLTHFNIREVPQTSGLTNQKLQSFGALDGFLFDALSLGSIDGRTWETNKSFDVIRSRLAECLEEFCQKHPRHRYSIPTAQYVGRHLLDMVGATKSRRSGGNRENVYIFPGLVEARQIFAEWARLEGGFIWDVE